MSGITLTVKNIVYHTSKICDFLKCIYFNACIRYLVKCAFPRVEVNWVYFNNSVVLSDKL